MNEERYQHLLAKLLDDELAADEAAEFTAWLGESPAACVEAGRQLMLWDLYAQQHCPERSAEAFAAACQTRLLAETGPQSFVEGVERRLRQEASAARAQRPPSLGATWLGRLTSLRWVLAGGVVAAIVGLGLWLFPAVNPQPTLSVTKASGVTLERAGRISAAQDGLRVLPGDVLSVVGTNTATLSYGSEPTQVSLGGGVELKILAWNRGKRFELHQGQIEATVARQRPFRPMLFTTKQAEARVLGTRFTLAATTNATRLDVTEGKVRFTRRDDNTTVKVTTGNYAIAMANYELAALPFTGHIRREWWSGVSGESLDDLRSDPRYPSNPDGSDVVPSLELKPVSTNQFGVRLCGYMHPPVTGDYEFWLTGGSVALLSMSPGENPAEIVPVARLVDASRDLDRPRGRGASAWAPPVILVAGRRYYVEALLLINEGEGRLSVAWKIPGREREPLTGEYLSPFKPK